MRRWKRCVGVFVLFTACIGLASGARAGICDVASVSTLKLNALARPLMIGPESFVLADPTGRLGYEDIRRMDEAGKFAPNCETFFESAKNGALWLRLDVANTEKSRSDWVIVFGEPEIDEAQLYQTLPNGLFSLKRTGRAVVPDARDVASRWPAAGFRTDPESEMRLYLRLSGVTAPFVSARIFSDREFVATEGRDLLIMAAILGFLAAMLVYSLVVYFRSRLHQCLYYFMYLFCVIANVVVYDGFLYRFSGTVLSGVYADYIAQALIVLAGICLLLFGRSLLELPSRASRAGHIVYWLAGALAVSFLFEVVGLVPLSTASFLFGVVAVLILCGWALWFAVKGFRPAIYFCLSCLALISGLTISNTIYYFPVRPEIDNPIISLLLGVQQDWSFHFGICAEAVLISFAITYFIRDMQTEVVDARAETTELRTEYESRVSAVVQNIGLGNTDRDSANDILSGKSVDEKFLDSIRRIVRDRLADDTLDVAELADELATSKPTLRRRLHKAAGLTPLEFIRQERLECARQMLEGRTHSTIAEVAVAVGIPTPGYFARLYREAFGHSPSEVLKNE